MRSVLKRDRKEEDTQSHTGRRPCGGGGQDERKAFISQGAGLLEEAGRLRKAFSLSFGGSVALLVPPLGLWSPEWPPFLLLSGRQSTRFIADVSKGWHIVLCVPSQLPKKTWTPSCAKSSLGLPPSMSDPGVAPV